MGRSTEQRVLDGALIAALALLGARLLVAALELPIDYFDGYEYLTNARIIAGHDLVRLNGHYFDTRPPMVPLLTAAVLAGYRPAGGGMALIGPHLLALLLTAGGVVATYGLFRQGTSRTLALLGALLLAANPIVVHYAPFLMADLPAMAFAAAATCFFLRARARGGAGSWLLATIFTAATMAAKYPGMLILASFVAFEVAEPLLGRAPEQGPMRRRAALRLVYLAVGALGLWYLIHVAAFARAYGWSAGIWTRLLLTVREGAPTGLVPYSTDPTFEYAAELLIALSPPLAALAGIGFAIAIVRRTRLDLLCTCWFVVTAAVLTFIVLHKEARYASLFLPPLAYFEAQGIAGVHRALVRLARPVASERVAAAAAALVLAAALIPAGGMTWRELRRFDDPLYSRPFLGRIAAWTLERVPAGEPVLVAWPPQGNFVLYPKDPVFSPDDEYFYFHHVDPLGLAYWLDRPQKLVPPLPEPLDHRALLAILPRSAVLLEPDPAYYDTNNASTVAEPPAPFRLTHVKRRTLRLGDASADRAHYAGDGGSIELVRADGGWKPLGLEGWELFARWMEGSVAQPFPGTQCCPPVLELVRVEREEMRVR